MPLAIMMGIVIISVGFGIPSYAFNPEWPDCKHWRAYQDDGIVYGEWWTGNCSNPNTNSIGKHIDDVM